MGNTGGWISGKMLRFVRFVRVLRTLRLMRLLINTLSFSKMIFALCTCTQTLFWSMLMLFFIIYCFSIWFTQATQDYLSEHGANMPVADDLMTYYGSVGSSIYTLFMS